MKKIYAIIVAALITGSGLFAQNQEFLTPKIPLGQEKKIQLQKEIQKRYANQSTRNNERWYNFGETIDQLLGGSSELNGLWTFPDSNMHVNWASGAGPLQFVSIADLLQVNSVYFNEPSLHAGEMQLGPTSTYNIVEIELWGIYVRPKSVITVDSIWVVDSTQTITLIDSVQVLTIADSTEIVTLADSTIHYFNDTISTDILFLGGVLEDTLFVDMDTLSFILNATDTAVYVSVNDTPTDTLFNGMLEDVMYHAGYELWHYLEHDGTDFTDIVYTIVQDSMFTYIYDTTYTYVYDTTYTYVYDTTYTYIFDTISTNAECVDTLIFDVAVNHNVYIYDFGVSAEFGTNNLRVPLMPYSGAINGVNAVSKIRVKVPMDNQFFADSLESGWHVVNISTTDLPAVNANRYTIMSASFKPGYPFSPGDLLEQNNRFIFVSLEETSGAAHLYTEGDYNCSSVADMDQRYGLAGSWNTYYMPSYIWSVSYPWEHHVIYYKASGLTNYGTVGIDEITENNEFILGNAYPNPANEGTEVIIPVNQKLFDTNANLNVFNSIGQVVRTEQVSLSSGANRISVNTSGLQKGVYFYALETENNRAVRSFVIN